MAEVEIAFLGAYMYNYNYGFLNPLPHCMYPPSDLDDLSCSVSCPSLYSSGSSSCTVSWSRPPTASCDALIGYTVIITGNGLSMKSPLLDIDTITYTTGQLEAFQIYTASVTATSTCGNTQPVNITFMTSRELSKCA